MNFYRSVIADETELTKLVHEMTDPRPSGADHFSQGCLTDLDVDRLGVAFLAEIREQQQQARQALFTRIEQLVDQIFFNPAVAAQQIRDEQFRECRFVAQDRLEGFPGNRRNLATFHRPCRADAHLLPGETAFTEELPRFDDSNDGFLALLGSYGQLDPALLQIVDAIGRLALAEDDLIPA